MGKSDEEIIAAGMRVHKAATLAALRKVREMVEGRVEMHRKDRLMPHHQHESESILYLIDAMIAEEERK